MGLSSADDVIELRDGSTTVAVDPGRGARLHALAVRGRPVLSGSVNPAVPAAMRLGSFPMVPFAGRVEGGLLPFAGRTWVLPANLGTSAAHGFGFDVPWWLEHADGSRVELAVELDARWPFGGVARQSIRVLADGVEVVVSVENDRRSMPATLGLHPWFARRPAGSSAVVRVSVPAGSRSLPDRPWDLCLTDLAQPPRAVWADTELVVESSTTTWTVYEQDPDAFCLEPLTHPVGAIEAGAGAVVEPGHPLSLTARFRLLPRTDR